MDCITVSTAPVKTTIDDLIQQLFDALLNSLRRNIVNHIQTIDNFVTEGMESLSTRPQTVEEIGLANAKHEELSKKIPEVSLCMCVIKILIYDLVVSEWFIINLHCQVVLYLTDTSNPVYNYRYCMDPTDFEY